MFDPPCVIGPGHVGRVGLRKPFRSPLQQGNPYQNYLARQFLGMHQALEYGELDNIFWLPGTENPAGCPAEVKSSMAPCFRMLQSGSLRPRALRPLGGGAPKRKGAPLRGGNSFISPLLLFRPIAIPVSCAFTHFRKKLPRGGQSSRFFFFPLAIMSSMASFDVPGVAQQVVAIFDTDTQKYVQTADVLGMVSQRPQLHPRESPFVDLNDPNVHLQFLSVAPEFALSLHACRRPRATALKCDAK